MWQVAVEEVLVITTALAPPALCYVILKQQEPVPMSHQTSQVHAGQVGVSPRSVSHHHNDQCVTQDLLTTFPHVPPPPDEPHITNITLPDYCHQTQVTAALLKQ